MRRFWRLVAIGWAVWWAAGASGQVTMHQVPEGVPANKEFRVKVGGKDCFVYNACVDPEAWDKNNDTFELAGFVNFDCAGPVRIDVEVARERPVKSALVRPRSKGVQAKVSGQRITLELPRPMHVVLELNGSIERPLYVFANPPEADIPRAGSVGVVGIKPGTFEPEELTPLLRRHPGKTILFGPGIYEGKDRTFKIRPVEGQTIYLAGGAYVKGSIGVRERDGVTIRGRGIIDKTGDLDYSDRGFTIFLDGAKNLRVDGITILNAHGWSICARLCQNAVVNNVKNISYRNGSDGCDPTSTTDMVISDCFFRVGDDPIAIKAGAGGNTENITVRGCTVWGDICWGGVTIGHESSAEHIKNIRVEDVDILHVRGSGLGIHVEGRALVSNVRYKDIRVEAPRPKRQREPGVKRSEAEFRTAPMAYLIDMGIQRDGRVKNAPEPTGRIDGVVIENLTLVEEAKEAPATCRFFGYSEKCTISNVHIKHLRWLGQPVTGTDGPRFTIEKFAHDIRVGP